MVVRRMTVKVGQQPTEEQKRRIRESIDRPISYYDDAPKLTDEQYRDFERKVKKQRKK